MLDELSSFAPNSPWYFWKEFGRLKKREFYDFLLNINTSNKCLFGSNIDVQLV